MLNRSYWLKHHHIGWWWLKSVSNKLHALGIPNQAKLALKQKIVDVERRADLGRYATLECPIKSDIVRSLWHNYGQLDTCKFRKVSTLVGWEAVPFAVLKGRCRRVPLVQIFCQCDFGEAEAIEHMIFRSKRYHKVQDKYITPLVKEMSSQTDLDCYN